VAMRNGTGNGKGAKRGASEKQTETAERDDSPTAAAAEDKVVADSNPNSTEYTSADIGELLYMLEEEKLAGDLYEAFYAQTGAKVFKNIAKSEDGHFNALLNQAEKIGLDTDAFTFLPAGEYVNDEIQDLYDSLLKQGSASKTAALEVGVLIEETDILDLAAAAAAVEGTALESVYERLLAGSSNHLDAFEAVLG
jgi:hypothetical protein